MIRQLVTAADYPEAFDSRFDSGGARFHGLDAMLATAFHSQIQSGELYRTLTRKMIVALKKPKLITGRQIVHLR